MKRVAAVVAILILTSPTAWGTRINETTEESRARHSAERYETYRRNNYQAPLGGYSERLGDPAPRGTISPGHDPDSSRSRDYRRRPR